MNPLPCPYCENKHTSFFENIAGHRYAGCKTCGAAGPAKDPNGDRWNAIARAVLSAQPPPAPGDEPFTDAEIQQMATSGWDHTRRLAAEVMEWRKTK